jgi:hypothetical protein
VGGVGKIPQSFHRSAYGGFALQKEGSRSKFNKFLLNGQARGCGSGMYTELAQNGFGMAIDCFGTNHQLLGDLFIRQSLGQQAQNLYLARGQVVRIFW